MSAAVRTALATAASTVIGISCEPYYRQSAKAGDAMVRRGGTTYPNTFGGVVVWQVIVVLPQDLATAQKYLDEQVPLIVAALEDEMRITSATPQQLEVPGLGYVPCAVIEGQREEENL